MIRVLIAAASAVVRAGLESILAGRPDIDVVQSLPAAALFDRALDRQEPDVVVADLDLATDSLVMALAGSAPGTGPPALVLLTDRTDDRVAQALRVGARAILARDAGPDEIAAAVRAAAAGLVVLDTAGLETLLHQVPTAARSSTSPSAETLTPREIEVLGLLAEGEGNKQIARHLGISEHTVKFHVGSILAKLGASSRTEAVTLGLRLGLIMV